ncbi:hypothetical protein ACHAWO_009306 [Cyclotella atomus]|uniref:HSF-type DNA-binding domain-containing protein n=1 Tax=Cyclotella atomus TaxID=382360 RepID=A0ABD3MMH6_9STRA
MFKRLSMRRIRLKFNEPTAVAAVRAPPNSRRKMSFAEKLYAILADKHLAKIITWLPSGKSFCILDKERFTKKVLPTYFREVQFDSFSRRIKRWGFRKMYTTGLKQVTYTHDLFQKDQIDLLKAMNGKPGQAAPNEAPGNAVADAAKFEDAMNEQRVPTNDTFRFNERPALVGYEQRAMFAPSQLQPEQIQMHEMAMMNRRPYPPMASSTIRGLLFEARLVPYQGAADVNVARQLSTLDDAIAECEEQLAILQRLAELRERRRALGR